MYNLPIICTIRRQIYNTSLFYANFSEKNLAFPGQINFKKKRGSHQVAALPKYSDLVYGVVVVVLGLEST